MAVTVKDAAKSMLEEGKYPKNDVGILSLSGDQGEVIALREGGKVTYQFVTLNKQVVLQIPLAEKGKKDPAPAPAKITLAPKPTPKAPIQEPQMVEQLGYNRRPELVDFVKHPSVITCPCGNVRYVAPGSVHEVSMCKPCTRRARRQRRRLSLKNRGITNTSEAKGLTFPEKKMAEAKMKKAAEVSAKTLSTPAP
jgi:hypothetical protein